MLYEFKSRATGTVIMTQDAAERILRIIGKTPQSKGVILPEQMAAAITALQTAIALERQTPASSGNADRSTLGRATDRGTGGTSGDPADVEPIEPAISLGQRAFPFLAMLRQAQAGGKEITWGG
jgi:Domain of unknown function (DUF1840)